MANVKFCIYSACASSLAAAPHSTVNVIANNSLLDPCSSGTGTVLSLQKHEPECSSIISSMTRTEHGSDTNDYMSSNQFDVVQDFSDHHYAKHSPGKTTKDWVKTIQNEWKLLQKDLPVPGGNRVRVFSYSELRKATHDFNGANKIGEGGFGSVFRGGLKDGTIVAVKVLSANSRQGIREFITELTAISDIMHENLITLVGCCAEGSHRILVYNYLENNSLAHTLLGSGYSRIRFNWRARVKIAVGVARGPAYLHDEIRPPMIHRDIKASNILLDKDLTPKISDFGLARLLPPNATHVSTRVAGTIGYLAPEYAVKGQVTKKSDIYSFGILLLEIVSGRCNHDTRLPYEDQFLLERTWTYYEQGHLEKIIDADLEDDLDVEEACRLLKVGLLCTQDAMKLRPNMTNIVRMLTGEKGVSTNRITKPAVIGDMEYLKVNKQGRS